MASVTWLGDEDPMAVSVTVGNRTFVKGEAVNVPDDELGKIETNPTFSTKKGAKPVEATQPEPADPEAGSTKAALKAKLRELGEDVKGNPSEDTLRTRLAEVSKKRDADAEKAREELAKAEKAN